MKAAEQAPEVIVIGAGLGGLCAAALLARAGQRVRVLDRASHAGGLARSRNERGYVHNFGAHALYTTGPAIDVLRSLGIAPRGGRPRGEGGHLVQDGKLEALPRGLFTTLTTGALDARGKLQLARVLGSLGERNARRVRGRSVNQWLDAAVPDARARGVVEAFVRLATYCHAPDRLGAESVTFAFLIALERLSPAQRAVLLLRDVFDYSVRETAEALELSEPNVKTTLHRAHGAMADYEAARCIPTPALRRRTERALRRFMLHLATDNVRAIEDLLREDVLARNDPGEFVAARKLVVGRDKVAFFHRKIMRSVGKDPRFAVRDLNGLPALVFEYTPLRTDFASRQIMRAEVDAHGRIREIHSVLASAKLKRVRFERLRKIGFLQQITADGVRRVLAHLQPGARKPSRFVQVHPRSRARR